MLSVDWSNLSGTDVIVAGAAVISASAAVVSAIIAKALRDITREYTAETEAIAAANRRMADANDEMVRSNEAVVDEMRNDRQHARHERSAGAAQRMTAATMALMLQWRLAEDDPGSAFGGRVTVRPEERPRSAEDKRRAAFNTWQTAYTTERADIHNKYLVEDLDRFGRIVATALSDWDAIRLLDDDGHVFEDDRRRPDYRSYRLGWCQRRLVAVLDAHRHGGTWAAPSLPGDAGSFMSLPVGTREADLDERYPAPVLSATP